MSNRPLAGGVWEFDSVEETEGWLQGQIAAENVAIDEKFRSGEGPEFSADVMTLRVFAPRQTDFPGISITDTPGLTVANIEELRPILRDLLLEPIAGGPRPVVTATDGKRSREEFTVRDFVIPVWVTRLKEMVTADGQEVDFWAQEHVPAMYANWRRRGWLSDAEVKSLVNRTQVVVSAMDTRFSPKFSEHRGRKDSKPMVSADEVGATLRLSEEDIGAGCTKVNDVLSDEFCNRGKRNGVPLGGVVVPVTWKPYLGVINHVGTQTNFDEARAIEDFLRNAASDKLSSQAQTRLGQDPLRKTIGIQYGEMLLRWAERVQSRGAQDGLRGRVDAIQVYLVSPDSSEAHFREVWEKVVQAVEATIRDHLPALMKAVSDAYIRDGLEGEEWVTFPVDQVTHLADRAYTLLCSSREHKPWFKLDGSVDYMALGHPSMALDRFPKLRLYLRAVFTTVLLGPVKLADQDKELVSAEIEQLTQIHEYVTAALSVETRFCGELVQLEELVRVKKLGAKPAVERCTFATDKGRRCPILDLWQTPQDFLKYFIAARLTSFTVAGSPFPAASLGSETAEALMSAIRLPLTAELIADAGYRSRVCGRALEENPEWVRRRLNNISLKAEVETFCQQLDDAAYRAKGIK